MRQQQPTQRYVARNALDLVALAPTVLGFHAEDSVVLMTFGPPGGSFHARVDLPVSVEAQAEVADVLVTAMLRNDLATAAVLLYTTDAGVARSQGRILLDALLAAGIAVIDVLRVEEERFFLVLEDDEDGTAYDLSTHPFTAERVFVGQVVHRDRGELADSLVGTDAADAARVQAAASRQAAALARLDRDGLREEGRWLQRRLRGAAPGDVPPDAQTAGRLLSLAAVRETRDVAWAAIDRDSAAGHVALWRDLVRRAPPELLPGAAALLAFAAWQHGDGALSWCAIDRCLEADPDYTMALSLAELLAAAVPPRSWAAVPETALELFAD